MSSAARRALYCIVLCWGVLYLVPACGPRPRDIVVVVALHVVSLYSSCSVFGSCEGLHVLRKSVQFKALD